MGYDLAGVRSPAVRSWIASMKDARAEVEAVRREIPDELRRLRDLDFRTALSDQVTLSTFHGCPADEIEAMTVFLMEEMGLHVTVKLNPTLLGRDAVDGLLHDVLGYRDVETRAEDFERDLQWGQALEMTDRLVERARALGRELRLKLSNTLVVRNHRRFFPPGEAVMYLSGPPLHVITLGLVERVRRARPDVPLSFSAGVDSRNFADCVALGLAPVTVCTDLLKPGGYGRLPKYLENLEERMRGMGVRTIGDYVAAGGLDAATAVARAAADPRYRAEALRRPAGSAGTSPSSTASTATSACPPARTTPTSSTRPSRWRGSTRAIASRGGGPSPWREAASRRASATRSPTSRTSATTAATATPSAPRTAGRTSRSLASSARSRHGGSRARATGSSSRGAWTGTRCGGGCAASSTASRWIGPRTRPSSRTGGSPLELRHLERAPVGASVAPDTPEGHTLDAGAYLTMAVLLDGVLDPRRANPVNATVAAP